MIAKIHNIRAVGKFYDYSPRDPMELGHLTLVYSDNGRGKSTLADIFRSLTLGDASRLVGRKTLKSDHDQLVKLELANEDKVTFANNNWHGQYPKVRVFDDVFICDNVYAGNTVAANHKRKLAQVIIGDAAVRAQETEDILKSDRDEQKDKKEILQAQIGQQILSLNGTPIGLQAVEDFVGLASEPNIDQAVALQETIAAQVTRSDLILSANQFKVVTLPPLPLTELGDLLGQSIEQIEENAEQQVREHLSRYSDGRTEDWIERGTRLLAEQADSCPFCGLELSGSQLIKHYQSYFNEEYVKLKEEISDFAGKHLDFETAINEIFGILVHNTNAIEFWKSEIPEIQFTELSHEEVKHALDNVVSQIRDLLRIKKNKPLEVMQLNGTVASALNQWSIVEKRVADHNREVNAANKQIASRRDRVKGTDPESENRKLIRLRNIMRRYSPDVLELCERYQEAKTELQQIEQQISETRENIDKAIDDLFVTYKDQVNEFLKALGAEFIIGDFVCTRDRTSVRLRNYGLVISGEQVGVGDPETPVGKASFKNTLSAGDRRTLAFAYFLAQLEALPDKDTTIVVFDDPLTSLDMNRRARTINAIRNVCADTKQVILMSHDTFFLHEFLDMHNERRGESRSTRVIKICTASGENEPSKLVDDWDLEAEVRDREAKSYKRVLDFVEKRSTESDMEDISRCARILLEQRCRFLYLDICQNANTFGSFMECVVQKRINSPEYGNLSSFNEKVKNVVNFLNPSHHSDLTAKRPPNETEIRDYCKDVLKLLGRL